VKNARFCRSSVTEMPPTPTSHLSTNVSHELRPRRFHEFHLGAERLGHRLHEVDVETFVASVRPRQAERSIVTWRADTKHPALLDRVETGLLRIGARRDKCDGKQHGESDDHD